MTRIPALAWKFALTCAAAAALAACGGGGGDGSKATTGTLKLGITDAPVDKADAVFVRFTGVEFKPRGGEAFSRDFMSPRDIDLLDFQGTNRAMLFDGEPLPAGEYEWMRLKVVAEPNVRDSYVVIGGECELRIPSGAESGLKLVRGFAIGVGTTTDITIDFDVRKSIVEPPGQRSDAIACNGQTYLLKPALRVVDNLQVGTITGTVDTSLTTTGACSASATSAGNVYLFGPFDTELAPQPDDIDGYGTDGADPITSAIVDRTDSNRFTIGFVPAGKYVLAHTCDEDSGAVNADTDQDANPPPSVDEVVNFTLAPNVVQVAPGVTIEVNFPPSA
jgi:hypothetical protein